LSSGAYTASNARIDAQLHSTATAVTTPKTPRGPGEQILVTLPDG
jgi:hypothetical protein